MLNLNERAWRLVDAMAADEEALNVRVSSAACGARILDCGVKVEGGLKAGRRLAEVCLGGLAEVGVQGSGFRRQETGDRGQGTGSGWPIVAVQTDQPVLACLASQYAGWQITGEKYFAMGSGPMRAAACREELFEHLGYRERADRVVGVLETGKLPSHEVCNDIASKCGVAPAALTLLAARTASIAGTLQVVARSVETALHKLHTIGYDVKRIVSGMGTAPLPPIAADDMAAIGRTNDAVLYGGEVTLWVRDDDGAIAEIGPKVPSCASADFGEPFAAIFERYGRDFYKIDPLLFSPAVITFVNLASGKMQRFGELRPDVVERSFIG